MKKTGIFEGVRGDILRLNLRWYAALPGVIVVETVVLARWLHEAQVGRSEAPGLALQAMLVAAVLASIARAMLASRRAFSMVAQPSRDTPFERTRSVTTEILAGLNGPCVIGLLYYWYLRSDGLLLAILLYAFAASALFKPDFQRLLDQSRMSDCDGSRAVEHRTKLRTEETRRER